jgi:hypothetical protein
MLAAQMPQSHFPHAQQPAMQQQAFKALDMQPFAVTPASGPHQYLQVMAVHQQPAATTTAISRLASSSSAPDLHLQYLVLHGSLAMLLQMVHAVRAFARLHTAGKAMGLVVTPLENGRPQRSSSRTTWGALQCPVQAQCLQMCLAVQNGTLCVKLLMGVRQFALRFASQGVRRIWLNAGWTQALGQRLSNLGTALAALQAAQRLSLAVLLAVQQLDGPAGSTTV